MKKKVLTVTIVAAIVAALMFVLTGCPTPPPPADETLPTVLGVTDLATTTSGISATVNATDNVGVTEIDATLTISTTDTPFATTWIFDAATSVTKTLTFDIGDLATGTLNATVTAVAKDAAGNVSTEKVGAATGLAF